VRSSSNPAFRNLPHGGTQTYGQYGPPVPVPADADAQTRLLGFIGRDPDWRPTAP